MPGNVQNSAASTTLPITLSVRFVRDQTFPVLANAYRNGESQRRAQANTPVRRWRLGKHLSPAALVALRDFYDARKAGTRPIFYDPYETDPSFTLAPSGDTGKYIVRFEGDWQQSIGIGLGDAEVLLVQIT